MHATIFCVWSAKIHLTCVNCKMFSNTVRFWNSDKKYKHAGWIISMKYVLIKCFCSSLRLVSLFAILPTEIEFWSMILWIIIWQWRKCQFQINKINCINFQLNKKWKVEVNPSHASQWNSTVATKLRLFKIYVLKINKENRKRKRETKRARAKQHIEHEERWKCWMLLLMRMFPNSHTPNSIFIRRHTYVAHHHPAVHTWACTMMVMMICWALPSMYCTACHPKLNCAACSVVVCVWVCAYTLMFVWLCAQPKIQ